LFQCCFRIGKAPVIEAWGGKSGPLALIPRCGVQRLILSSRGRGLFTATSDYDNTKLIINLIA
jgi:hypothetical protein